MDLDDFRLDRKVAMRQRVKRPLRRLGSAITTLTLSTAALVVPQVAAHAAPGNIVPPFDIGQTWNICEGYAGPTHTGTSYYGLDLTGAGCDNSAAGRTVRAPISGTIYYWQPAYGNLCVNLAGGRSLTLTHIVASKTTGSVAAGEAVGTVAPAGQMGNNGVAHLHLQIWAAPGCYNSAVIPFDQAHGAQICGAPDLTPTGPSSGNGIWSGTRFTGDNCGVPPSPPADTDADGVPDSSDVLPTIPGPANNRGAPLQTSRLSGDFNGDGKRDVAVFYDYGGGLTKIWLFTGAGDGSFAAPVVAWDSGPGNWDWSHTKPIVGDFNSDSKTDIAVLYDYGSDRTKIWLFTGTTSGLFPTPTVTWDSGVGNWDWSRSLPIVGDFNGDGKRDIAVFYDYSGGLTKIWLFTDAGDGSFAPPAVAWDSGPGNWDWSHSKPIVGDFNSDSKTDIAVLYDYGSDRTKIWLFTGTTSGLFPTPTVTWDSGVGNWDWSRSLPLAGDFNGDGKIDIAIFYDYSGGLTKIWSFIGDGAGGFALPQVTWDSGPGNWEWLRSMPLSGEFNGDTESDIAVFYNYDSGRTKIWSFSGTVSGAFSTPITRWDSGPGNWEWLRTLVP